MAKIYLKYKPTGEITELDFCIKRLGYSNELVICNAWSYAKSWKDPEVDPNNWEIVSIDGFSKEVKND